MTRRLAQLVRGKVRRGLVDAADGGAHPKCPHDGKRRGRWLLASAVIGTSPRVPGSTFGLTRLEANSPVGIPGKYDVESTR